MKEGGGTGREGRRGVSRGLGEQGRVEEERDLLAGLRSAPPCAFDRSHTSPK